MMAILTRLLRLLGLGGGEGPADSGFTVHRSETFQVRDPTTGRVTHYSDRSQLPSSLREALEKAESQGGTHGQVRTETHHEYRVTDADGNLRVYKSLDEMPPEIRAMLGKKR